jgi:hypothetical protein
MKKYLIYIAALLITAIGSASIATAQINISLPKIPKVKKPKAEQTNPTKPEDFNPSQDDIYTNKMAPPDFDANLKANDLAVGVVIGSLEPIKITGKSNGIYQAKSLDSREVTYYFRANSVYPNFNVDEFKTIVAGNYMLDPYLECYAKKYNLELINVTGDGFSPPQFDDAKEMKTALEPQQSKLAQLANSLKNLQSRPNTFLNYQENPAIWEEITNNRAAYLQCALTDKESKRFEESVWLKAHRDGIKKTLKYVEEYDPATKISMGTESEYALYAVSPKARAAWLKDKNALDFAEPINTLLAPLAAALAKQLPKFQPPMQKYPFGTPADFALMKKAFSNPARYQIYKVGLQQNTWVIDKNSLGIPNARYKNGLFYLRDTQSDHPYCFATYVNIVQDYSGGGTYAASRANFIQDELVGCPTK